MGPKKAIGTHTRDTRIRVPAGYAIPVSITIYFRGSGPKTGGPAPNLRGQGQLTLALARRVGPGPGPDRPFSINDFINLFIAYI